MVRLAGRNIPHLSARLLCLDQQHSLKCGTVDYTTLLILNDSSTRYLSHDGKGGIPVRPSDVDVHVALVTKKKRVPEKPWPF